MTKSIRRLAHWLNNTGETPALALQKFAVQKGEGHPPAGGRRFIFPIALKGRNIAAQGANPVLSGLRKIDKALKGCYFGT